MLDLPVPLRPMMHTRSPRAICQDTLSNNGVAPNARDTSLNLSRVMIFSKNRARILPDLSRLHIKQRALRHLPTTGRFFTTRYKHNAFIRLLQPAKLRQCNSNSAGFAVTFHGQTARKSHAQPPVPPSIQPASHCLGGGCSPGHRHHPATSILR
ncbi:hypothetical protein D3C80_1482600 [compost metagenome]